MAKDDKSVSLIILGIVAILAIVGLVLMFSKAGVTGNTAKGSYPAGYTGQQQGSAGGPHPETVHDQAQKAAAAEGSSSASNKVVGKYS